VRQGESKPPLAKWATASVASYQQALADGRTVEAKKLGLVTGAEAELFVKNGYTPKEIEEALVAAYAEHGMDNLEIFLRGQE
jgi:hypothetical protein